MPAYPHAELMALYAKDAAETDKPWERWESRYFHKDSWGQCDTHPKWIKNVMYRRKPERPWYRVALMKTILGTFYTFTADVQGEKGKEQPIYPEVVIESHPNFVKWLTDQVYYYVE